MAYGLALLAAAWLSHFAVLSNDVFPLRWQADHLSFRDPESFYNGFFPIGYPLLLRVAALTGNPVLVMMLLQIALSSLYAFILYRLLCRLVNERAAIVAFPFVLFAPQVIRAVLSATPDFLAALSVLIGLLFFAGRGTRRNVFLAGVSMGIGCLFRTHVIVFALTFSLGLLSFESGRRLRTFFGFWVGVLPFVIVQGLVQVWSGHGFLETSQAFNIWKTMHGMDWNNPPALAHASGFDLIRQDPVLFLTTFWSSLVQNVLYLLPLLLVFSLALTRDRSGARRVPRELSILTMAALPYIGITVTGNSPRNLTLVIPIIAAAAIFLIERVARGWELSRRSLMGLVALLWLVAATDLFVHAMRSAGRVEDYTEVGRLLDVRSKNDALQIYTDDFDLYFPDLKYQPPRTYGGWPELGLPHYLNEFLYIHDSTAAAEHSDLVRSGAIWAIFRIPPYDVRGYQSVRSDTGLFRLTYRTRFHEIYRVQ